MHLQEERATRIDPRQDRVAAIFVGAEATELFITIASLVGTRIKEVIVGHFSTAFITERLAVATGILARYASHDCHLDTVLALDVDSIVVRASLP